MSGKVMAGAPWTRRTLAWFEYQHPASLAQLEAVIPDGHHITLTCGSRPKPLGAVLVGPQGEVARVNPVHPTVSAAAYAVLRKASEVAA